jgi:hypothetical protein
VLVKRNTKEENEAIKAGKTPERGLHRARRGWEKQPHDALAGTPRRSAPFDPSIKFPVRSKEFPARPPKIPCSVAWGISLEVIEFAR